MSTTRIVVIGAGSHVFGGTIVTDIVTAAELREGPVEVVLVDRDEARLKQMLDYAGRVCAYTGSPVRFSATTDRVQALKGARYVLMAVAVHRYELWEQDFRVPLSLGIPHILGENGGPGALFHALRNYELVIPICQDIERLCPDALLLNFTNPEARILAGILRLTKVRAVGLCHGFYYALDAIEKLLGRPRQELDIRSAGMNHLYWVYRLADAASGRDLFPELSAAIAAKPSALPPLCKYLYDVFGVFTMPSDDHIGEYLAFAHEFCGLRWHYGLESRPIHQPSPRPEADWRGYIEGSRPLDDHFVKPSGELAIPIIGDIELDRGSWRAAVNVMNVDGYIANVPHDAVVEVPATVDAGGVHAESVGPAPESFAALMRRQFEIQALIVEAYRERSRPLLLHALLLDPTVTSARSAEKLLDIMFELQAEYLPAFS